MSEDSMLMCLIAFVLGFLVARMMRKKNGFTQDINCKVFTDKKFCEIHSEDKCMWDQDSCVKKVNCIGEANPSSPFFGGSIKDCEVAYNNDDLWYNDEYPDGSSCQWNSPPMDKAYATQDSNYYQCVRDGNKCVNSKTRCIPKE